MTASGEFLEVIRETRRFALKEFGDKVLDWDLDPEPARVAAIWEKSKSLDIPALLIPEQFGGVGCGPSCGAMILETLARQCPGVASVYAHHFAACRPLAEGTLDQKNRFWGEQAARDSAAPGIAAVVFPGENPEDGLSLARDGEDFILTGKAPLAANLDYADYFCVFTEQEQGKASCVVVRRDAPGASLGPDPCLPGLKVNPFHALACEQVRIKAGDMIGQPGQATGLLKDARDLLFAYTASMALGAARTACEKALAYARRRYQFGRMIIEHQEIRRMLGSMRMSLDAGAALCMQWFGDAANPLAPARPEASLVKAFCTDAAFAAVVDAIQIHGGYGYMHEQGLEKLMRDVKVLQLLGGSNPRLMVDAVS